MMRSIIGGVVVVFIMGSYVHAQSALPPCPTKLTPSAYEEAKAKDPMRPDAVDECLQCYIVRHECSGELVYPTGERLAGEWQHNWLVQGSMSVPGGESFVGSFEDHRLHGTGTYTAPNGDRYAGSFKKGRFDGALEVAYANGDTYAGNFFFDKRMGFGTYVWKDGSRYAGEWYDSMPTKNGVHISQDGTAIHGVSYKIHERVDQNGWRSSYDGYLTYALSGLN